MLHREEDVAALPGGAEDYVRDSIHSSLGLPVSDRSLRLKLLASEDHRRRLQDQVFSLEEELRAAHRRIELLKAEAAMNAAGLRRCVEDKEALSAEYNDLATKSAKECALYERDLERAMESCDELARENDQLRARVQQVATLEALTAQVQDLQQQNERLVMNLNKADAEVDKVCDDNKVLDEAYRALVEENKRLLRRLEKERQRRSEMKQSATTSAKNKRKSSSLKDGSPAGRAIDFSPAGAHSSRHPLSPLSQNSPDYRAHKK